MPQKILKAKMYSKKEGSCANEMNALQHLNKHSVFAFTNKKSIFFLLLLPSLTGGRDKKKQQQHKKKKKSNMGLRKDSFLRFFYIFQEGANNVRKASSSGTYAAFLSLKQQRIVVYLLRKFLRYKNFFQLFYKKYIKEKSLRITLNVKKNHIEGSFFCPFKK